MKRRALTVGLAVAMAATFLGAGPASATWTPGDGAVCRDWLFNNQVDVCSASAASERLPRGTVGWDAINYLTNDQTYVSLWRYYAPGNATYTGQSTAIDSLLVRYGFHQGEFSTYDCAQYVIGIGWWYQGVWHGTWQSPPAWSC